MARAPGRRGHGRVGAGGFFSSQVLSPSFPHSSSFCFFLFAKNRPFRRVALPEAVQLFAHAGDKRGQGNALYVLALTHGQNHEVGAPAGPERVLSGLRARLRVRMAVCEAVCSYVSTCHGISLACHSARHSVFYWHARSFLYAHDVTSSSASQCNLTRMGIYVIQRNVLYTFVRYPNVR